MPGRAYVGTSGFAYKEWKPAFYPADLKQADFLTHYASRLPSVEINNTFYRTPAPDLLARWMTKTPEDFTFTLKAPQRITHIARLRDVDELVRSFLETAGALGARLGAILFQCPPTLRYDGDLLGGFLAVLPGEPFRFAMEFRHASWDTAEARDLLAANGVAWCVAEEAGDLSMVQTAKTFVYLRLRRTDYDDARIDAWGEQIRTVLAAGSDAYVYFKHEDDPSGVRYALRLLEQVAPTSED